MSGSSGDIAASTVLTFAISDVKTPPSLSVVTGFTLKTLNSASGLID